MIWRNRLFWIAILISAFIFVCAASAQDELVSIGSSDELGAFLVDSAGMTLYIFTNDAPNASNCTDGCLENWPPLTVASADELTTATMAGTFGTIEQDDGTFLVTYNRQPLYYFAGDEAAGDTTGQARGDVWWVARLQTVGLNYNAELGTFLTDTAGNTLYLFSNDIAGTSNCSGECLENWPPAHSR